MAWTRYWSHGWKLPGLFLKMLNLKNNIRFSYLYTVCLKTIEHLNLKLWIFSGHKASFKIWVSKVQDFGSFVIPLAYKHSSCYWSNASFYLNLGVPLNITRNIFKKDIQRHSKEFIHLKFCCNWKMFLCTIVGVRCWLIGWGENWRLPTWKFDSEYVNDVFCRSKG